jgi:hypothetical protein
MTAILTKRRTVEVHHDGHWLTLTIHRAGQLEVSTTGPNKPGITQFLDFADPEMLLEALSALLKKEGGS